MAAAPTPTTTRRLRRRQRRRRATAPRANALRRRGGAPADRRQLPGQLLGRRRAPAAAPACRATDATASSTPPRITAGRAPASPWPLSARPARGEQRQRQPEGRPPACRSAIYPVVVTLHQRPAAERQLHGQRHACRAWPAVSHTIPQIQGTGATSAVRQYRADHRRRGHLKVRHRLLHPGRGRRRRPVHLGRHLRLRPGSHQCRRRRPGARDRHRDRIHADRRQPFSYTELKDSRPSSR